MPQSRLGVYKKSEWEERKDLILRLYSEEHCSVSELIETLARDGFYVNKRMVMTRILQWGIGRKRRLHEMCAAVQLLADYQLADLADGTKFMVREQPVSLGQIRHYFRRKGILELEEYVRGLPAASGSTEVQLTQIIWRTGVNAGESSSSGSVSVDATPQSDATSQEMTLFSPARSPDMRNWRSVQNVSPTSSVELSTTSREADRLLWSIASYVGGYGDSPHRLVQQEPQVHHLTVHGRFGSHMQEGISLMIRENPKAAFASFNHGFDLVLPLLDDIRPTSLTLVLTIITELLCHPQLLPVIKQLVKHVVELCKATDKVNHPVSHLFQALDRLGSLSHWQIIQALHRADDDTRLSQGRLDWRSLYIRERLCDALYYAGEDSKRSHIRHQLLQDQIDRYGPNARNVLWTQTIVADDLMHLEKFDDAEKMFKEVLTRAEHLEGFGKAKTRFAALEGLGNTELKRLDDIFPDTARIEEAISYFESAETEARIWFEHSTRRVERVRTRRKNATLLLSQMQNFQVDEPVGAEQFALPS